MADPTRAADGTDADDWRAGILAAVLRVVFVLGAIVGVASSIYGIRTGQPQIALVDAIAITFLGIIAFARLAYRSRATAFLALSYGLGVWFLLAVGVVSQIYLIAFPVLTALLLGLRPAIAALVLTATTLAGAGVLANTTDLIDMGGVSGVLEWTIVVLNFVFVSTVLATSCAVLLDRLERSLEDRRRAEAEAARLARAIEQAAEVVLIAAPDGTVEYSNRAHRDLLTRVGDEAKIERLQDLRTGAGVRGTPAGAEVDGAEVDGVPADAVDVAAAVASHGRWRGTVTIVDPSTDPDDLGGALEFDTEITPVNRPDGSVANLVATLRDVTNERALERRLRRAEKLESLGTLASGVAHDFNNVIAAIMGSAESLERELSDDPRRSDASTIIAACERARDVVRQMMVFGRLSPVGRSTVSVADAVRAARPFLRAAIGSDIAIHEEITTEALVLANPGDIHQMLANLVGNAAQAMAGHEATARRTSRDASVTIRVASATPDADIAETHPRLVAGRPYVVLTVRDNGPGIPRPDIDRIFDPFYTTKAPDEGTGLGLASVHAIVVALGGEIGVYSELGVGTTFRIYLPEHVDGAGHASPDWHTSNHHTSDHTSIHAEVSGDGAVLRILLVDDEAALLAVTARTLTNDGHQVTRATDGDTARTLFDDAPESYDLVITDLTMPRMNGVELIRHVQGTRPTMPVILMSGFGEATSLGDMPDGGRTAYLSKPFARDELRRTIDGITAGQSPGS